ncbi:hypothetical protein MNV49_000242 [Pseudohyphozyma bogoriensis]|nr:hypothetical protein MNV49_000242 [Pseudohyphozyma bogoriensis]
MASSTELTPRSSPNFNASDADLTLLSSDNVKFAVHRYNLAAASQVFSDMIQLGQPHGPTHKQEDVKLEETAEVLEIVLPYTYPAWVKPFELDFPKSFDVIKAFDKYGIWRGIDAITRALQ